MNTEAGNNGNVLSHDSRGQKANIRVSAGLIPSGGSRPKLVLAFSLLTVAGSLDLPWLVGVSLQSLPLGSHDTLPCVSVCPLLRTPARGLRARLTPA